MPWPPVGTGAPTRLRHGQVHQPERARRLRRAVRGVGADHRAGQPPAVSRSGPTAVGPVRYEVLEPMRRVRFSLEPNDCQPLAFDWVYEAVLPPSAEDRTHQRTPLGYRVSAELVRYHQIGTASGWVELDGHRQEINAEEWVSTRDHSWGVRYDVGTPPTDMDPFNPVAEMNFQMLWCPVLMSDPDGRRWGLFMHLVDTDGFGQHHRTVMGAIEEVDGTGAPDGRHPTRPRLRPRQSPAAGRPGGGDPGGRRCPPLRTRGAHRYWLPSGHRPLLRLARPPSRRVARRAPRSTANDSPTAAVPSWPGSSISSATPSSTSVISIPGRRDGATASP